MDSHDREKALFLEKCWRCHSYKLNFNGSTIFSLSRCCLFIKKPATDEALWLASLVMD